MSSQISQLSQFSMGGSPVKNLSRFKALCERLGNPQGRLRFIHIAGTNGKGSTSEYVANALKGYTVGKFTSPYLAEIYERIQLNGKNISEEQFNYYLNIVIDATVALQIAASTSQFEVLTAMAFLYFTDSNTDYVVLETGIGGLLDCTNIVTPLVSIITTINYDHMAILGSTIEEIATHKVGIIKENIPIVAYPKQLPIAMDMISNTANNKHSPLIVPNLDELTISVQDISGSVFRYKNSTYKLKMVGIHQIYNAITAIEALTLLQIDDAAIKYSLQTSVLPARLQTISVNPYVILDGAHNPEGISSACTLISADKRVKYAVIGMLKSKDYKQSLQILEKMVTVAIFVDDFNVNAVPKEELEHISNIPTKFTCDSTANAYQKLLNLLENSMDSMGIIIGSLYLSGKILGQEKIT